MLAAQPVAPDRSAPLARVYPLPWNTTSTPAAATNAEYFYDYAGQDPINNYDLDGRSFCSITQWFFVPSTIYCNRGAISHAVGRAAKWSWGRVAATAKWIAAHPYQAGLFAAGIGCMFASGGTAVAICALGVGAIASGVDVYHEDKTGQGFDLGGIACAVAGGMAEGKAAALDHACTVIAGLLGAAVYGRH